MVIKKGFTLSEVLITLTIIGIGAAILTPIIINITPDSNIVAFKKAYSTIEQAVSTLVNDEDYYPSCRHILTKDSGGNDMSVPAQLNIPDAATLSNISTQTNGECTGGDVPPSNTNKFCYLFTQQVKTSGTVNCNQSTDANGAPAAAANLTFTSQNGMSWVIVAPSPQFPISDTDYSTRIIVDVNGSKGPNCSFLALSYNGYSATACSSSKVWPTNQGGQAPDIYDIGVRYDGSLTIFKMSGSALETVNIDKAANAILNTPMKSTTSKYAN